MVVSYEKDTPCEPGTLRRIASTSVPRCSWRSKAHEDPTRRAMLPLIPPLNLPFVEPTIDPAGL